MIRLASNTPKAFANFSPGLERSDNPGTDTTSLNPERVRPAGEPFQGLMHFRFAYPGLSLRSNPGLKLANAFSVLRRSVRLTNDTGTYSRTT